MKIDDVIERLQVFKKEFGNLDVYIPEVIATSTRERYSRRLNFNNCRISVCHYRPLECAVIIEKEIN